jgi:3-oxoacyl-[acyl-carrier protein] reductase
MEAIGKAAIVTGSSRRMGRAIARALARSGVGVMINARSSRAEAEAVVEEIREAGGRAEVCLADVARPEDARRLIDSCVERFGRLDILVNNAAVRANAAFDALSFEEWRRVCAVVLDGAFLCSQAAAPHLLRTHGRIVNIGGIAAHRAAIGRVHVVAAKSGLVGLTKALALELAPDVTVNCVAPGKIEDPDDSGEERDKRKARFPDALIPARRSGSTDDVAQAVLYLSSEAAGYVTGQTLHVNGGAFWC